MRKFKQFAILTLLALGLGGRVTAQEALRSVTVAKLWDADDSTYTYCATYGKPGAQTGGTSRGGDYVSSKTIKTSGGSVHLLSGVASSGAFALLDVGDIIHIVQNGQVIERVITVKTSDNDVTVDQSTTISTPTLYYWRHFVCGTDGTAGAIYVADLDSFILTVQVAQMSVDSGAVTISIECRHPYGSFLTIETAPITAGGSGSDSFLTRIFHDEVWESCRAGVKVADDDGTDTGANAEQVNIFLSGKGRVQ